MDLSTKYLGLQLSSPLVPSSSPLTHELGNIKRMEDAGAGAVVLFSLFEEQVKQEVNVLDYYMHYGTESFAEAVTYFPEPSEFKIGTERYLELLQKASQSCRIPVIASLNGVSNDGWIDIAKKVEQAGAKAIELNIYYIPTNLDQSGAQLEEHYLSIVKAIKAAVKVPVAVKLGAFFSSVGNMAKRLDQAGADGLVLFNRFYQPDFDLVNMEVVPTLELSRANEIRLPLLWLSILHGRLKCSLAATRGVETGTEVCKYILAGADVVQTTSALLHHGIGHLSTLRQQLEQFMEEKEYASVAEMRGAMSRNAVANPAVFERANYIKILQGYQPGMGL